MENDFDDNSEKSIKSSPNYEQQVDEIELLKNIIPEKVKILQEEPNFTIQFEIEANDVEEPIKKFYLIIYLNYNYPEQSADFKIYEINNNISEKSESNIKNKITEYCNENKGFPVIYQLYEMCQEFANEEEKKNINEGEKVIIPYELNNLNKIKTIKEFPIDMILLKNGNILIINKDNIIKIYNNQFNNILFETLESVSSYPILFSKYFPSNMKNENDYLYLFVFDEVLIYELIYLSKKKISEEYSYKINGNIMIRYIDSISSLTDVIEFPNFKNCVYFINNKNGSFLLDKYIKKKGNKKTIIYFDRAIIDNKAKKIFRKLYKINSETFIIASYTLKRSKKNKIEGINKMLFLDNKNFSILKEHDIKISPLNHSIANYKDKYIIVSYFKVGNNNPKKKNDDELINFKNKFNKLVWEIPYTENYNNVNIESFYNKLEDINYSYDITEHCIGIFNLKTYELVTIYEFDPIIIIYNINNIFLSLLVKSEVNYICFLLFDEGIKIYQENFNYSFITSFLEINKGILAIGSMKKGIIIYSK